jgi:hypothetical protein
MSDDNAQDGAEPSPASAGSHNTDMATARLSAANAWLQDEIKRLRLTDEERKAIAVAAKWCEEPIDPIHSTTSLDAMLAADTLRGLLKRLT